MGIPGSLESANAAPPIKAQDRETGISRACKKLFFFITVLPIFLLKRKINNRDIMWPHCLKLLLQQGVSAISSGYEHSNDHKSKVIHTGQS